MTYCETLMLSLHRLLGRERRRAERWVVPGLVAYYWDGDAPVAHPVGEISSVGMYLLTEQRWYLGTVLIMRLQQSRPNGEPMERSIAVQTKIARLGADGVGISFASLANVRPSHGWRARQDNAVDKKTLARFVRECSLDSKREGASDSGTES